MKIILTAAILMGSIASQAEWVNGYTKKDGTYVNGHHKSDRNNTKLDNYSTHGNYNPYTGKSGTVKVDPYANPYGSFDNSQNNND